MGRIALAEQELKKRREWKALFLSLSNRRQRRTAAEIAERVRASLGEDFPATMINLFRAAQSEGNDVRVPPNARIANALMWALQDLGVWSDIPQEKQIGEQESFLNLLGFPRLTRPTQSVISDLKDQLAHENLRGVDGVVTILRRLHDVLQSDPKSTFVLTMSSSTDFLLSRQPRSQNEVVKLLEESKFQLLCLIGQDWSDRHHPNRVLADLKAALKSSVRGSDAEVRAMNGRLRVAMLPAGASAMPSLASVFTRVAFVSKLLLADSAVLTLESMAAATVEVAWVQVTGGLDDEVSRWVFLKDIGSFEPYLREFWGRLQKPGIAIQGLMDPTTEE